VSESEFRKYQCYVCHNMIEREKELRWHELKPRHVSCNPYPKVIKEVPEQKKTPLHG